MKRPVVEYAMVKILVKHYTYHEYITFFFLKILISITLNDNTKKLIKLVIINKEIMSTS